MLCTEILERTSSVLCVCVCVSSTIAFCCITTKKCIDRGASGRHHRRRRSLFFLSLSLSPLLSLIIPLRPLSLAPHPRSLRASTFPLVFLLLFNTIRDPLDERTLCSISTNNNRLVLQMCKIYVTPLFRINNEQFSQYVLQRRLTIQDLTLKVTTTNIRDSKEQIASYI